MSFSNQAINIIFQLQLAGCVSLLRVCVTAQGVHLWGILWPTPVLLILIVIMFWWHRTLQCPARGHETTSTSRRLHCPLQGESRMHLWIFTNISHVFNVNKKVQLDATVCRHLFTAESLYMFRVSQHPSSGALKTVTATSGIGHNTGTATSFQRGLIRSPDQTMLEGSSCTSIMTYTRGSGYSF